MHMGWDHMTERLSGITTLWTILRAAQAGQTAAAADAQQQIMLRYGGAVYRYLLAMLRDPAAADDLTQEFALGLVRGAYRQADPGRGRFRDYVKTVLFHLVSTHRARERRGGVGVPMDHVPEPPAGSDDERDFVRAWREDLLLRTMNALAAVHPDLHAVLSLRSAHPKMPSHLLAAEVGRQLGRPWRPDAVRQALRRARTLFADLLLEEVARSLERPTVEQMQGELAELDLLEYVQPALERRAGASEPEA
jgi:RNA polymerase sigma-70 factor (ECF subfamily)